MLATLCLLVADEALGQRFSATIYNFMAVTNGTKSLSLEELESFLAAASAMLSMYAKPPSLSYFHNEGETCQRQDLMKAGRGHLRSHVMCKSCQVWLARCMNYTKERIGKD